MRRMVIATLVALVAIGALPWASAQQAPVRGTEKPALWVDASGAIIGPSFGYDMLLRADDYAVVLYLDEIRGGATWNLQNFLVFTEPDCQGQAYIGFLFRPYVGANAGFVRQGATEGQYELLVGAQDGETIPIRSVMYYPMGECGEYPMPEDVAYPIIATYDLSKFKPPFRVR